MLKYFDLEDEISSPTFTIVNEYYSKHQNIYHFDVYRLEDSSEFYAIGGDEYFQKGICLIEWGEKIEDALPLNYRKISFSRDLEHENRRVLDFENFDDIDI
ncbi:MAG: tRNA (adenosine(37)-N6)-threonylcarbamoyltransferase complex ATPase subunit type 1 TsaE [Clostridia bacterium]|nr:tRNA (adenosine(37)-N6)-threonylcarbamoyltransferase complex ATPase subunit type 1 TsaE [Clostridia bacterium]